VLSELCTRSAGVARLRPLNHRPPLVPSH